MVHTVRQGTARSRRNRLFTLVELMLVAVIVAILAAVAIPLMSANVTRMRVTEAEAALGMIRSAMRTMYNQTRDYTDMGKRNDLGQPVTISAGDAAAENVPGIKPTDLDGRFFSHECYTFSEIDSSSFVVECDGSASNAPRADDVNGDASGGTPVDHVVITMDHKGRITHLQGL